MEWHSLDFVSASLLLFFATCAVVSASDPPNATGFISIDCGSTNTQFKDPRTGLMWLNDSNYTKTGSNGVVSSHVDSTLDNSNALNSFRYFPIHRNKHCYDLKLSSSSVLVLIRAMFFRGSASELPLPISFDVSVNANIWFTVQYDAEAADDLMEPIVREGTFHATPLVYLCLLPNQGVPFISSLEVRPLDPGGVMYDFDNRDQLYLSNLLRLNTGAASDAPTVRYPDDIYDRFWVSKYDDLSAPSTKVDVSPKTPDLKLNAIPIEVLSDSWDWTSDYDGAEAPNGITFDYKYFNFSFPDALSRAIYLYPIFYFEPGGQYVSDVTYVNITLNGQLLDQQFNVTNTTAKDFDHVVLPNHQASFKIDTTSPVLSAVEFYEEVINNPSMTSDGDVDTVTLLKSIYSLEDWQGDPCIPMPYDWLGCGPQNAGTSLLININSVTLSNLSNGDDLFKLGYGDIYGFVGLSLSFSQINDTVWDYLLNIISNSDLKTLNLDHNLISKTQWLIDTSGIRYYQIMYLESLILSYNLLSGEVPSLVNASFTDTLQQLNFSHNKMTSLPLGWGNLPTDSVLKSLTTLDLSFNSITSDISSLNTLVQRNLNLREVHLSNNFLRGLFPSSLYFNLTNLRIMNIDNNLINGILDLTIWRDNLLRVLNNSSTRLSANSSSSINTVFSFVNNKITGIQPGIEDLEPIIGFYLRQQDSFLNSPNTSHDYLSIFNTGGILLGENPFCQGAQSRSKQYVCRSSLTQIVLEQKKKANKAPIIVGAVLGGVSVIICSIVVALVTWKYFKEVRQLRTIQYGLVQQDVQPRYYHYSDIRHATQNFHDDNMLGKGGFGIVYKGKLEDGPANSCFIAVKKLFHSAENRVLNEFLNEVVLISGIKHRNLIQLRGCCIREKERILIYELADGSNLADALWGKVSRETLLDWNTRHHICVGIARGLAYLHEELQPKIIHRDIKAANILLDKNANAKIGDFGLAKPIPTDLDETNFTANVGGTRGYMAAELGIGLLTEKSDVFSFGILLLEIISGRPCLVTNLHEDRRHLKTWVEQLQKERKLLNFLQHDLQGICPEDEVLNLINIALICVKFNPKSRPKMSEVVSMLVGNVDLKIFLNRRDSYNETFLNQHDDDLHGSSKSFYTLEIERQSSLGLDEEPESPLLIGSSSNRTRTSRGYDQSVLTSGDVASIELSRMSGR